MAQSLFTILQIQAHRRRLAALGLSFALAFSGLAHCANPKEIDHSQPLLMLWFLIQLDPLAPLTDYDFAQLPNEQKYRVANRMLGSMYTGIALDKLFVLDNGLDNRAIRGKYANFMSMVNMRMLRPLLPHESQQLEAEVATNQFNERSREEPLARLYHYPVTKERTNVWMAYILANSVQFSPARELDTVEDEDMQRVYNRLLNGIRADRPISEILYQHMTSQENWRRFRSPEDNTREMMEIYLGHFNDEDVPKASQACQNWSLDQNGNLVIGPNVNRTPQTLSLGVTVTTCEDFYRAVANHDLVPGALGYVLIDRFFPHLSDAQKRDMAMWIILRKPHTHREIFTTIINSRAYLLTAERGRYFEESFYNLRAKTGWQPNSTYFRNLPGQLAQMHQDVFELKLGRERPAPVDSLSLAHHHTRLRDSGVLDIKRDPNNSSDAGWSPTMMDVPVSDGEYVRYLFLSVLEREPHAHELATLNEIFADQGYTMARHKDRITMIVLDYCSRLPDLYVYPSVF